MNKYLFFLGLTGMTLLSACNSDELGADNPSLRSSEEERSLIVEAGKNSDIPITFGAIGVNHNVITRAPIELDENNLFETTPNNYMGVFCLATDKQEGAPSFVGDVVWNDPNNIANWKVNVPAKITINGTSSEVKFLDPTTLSDPTPDEKPCYYPLGNWYHYNFYAYYPRIPDENAIHVGANSVIVDFEINGKQDIIWGQTTPPNNQAGYSYKYFRENGSAEAPQYGFSHKLAQLIFKVKSTTDVKVESLTLQNVCCNLSLVVAGSTSQYGMGALFENGPSTGVINAWKLDDTPITTPIDVSAGSETGTEIGYMMVPPTAAFYEVAVKIEGVDDPKTGSVGPVVAGKKYTFTLNIN